MDNMMPTEETGVLQMQKGEGGTQQALQSAIESLLLQTMVQILEQMTLIRYLSNGHRDRVLENLIYLRDAADSAISAEMESMSPSHSRERY